MRKGERAPAFSFNTFFWRSEYQTHQRPAYFTSVRLYSARNHSMEIPYNPEGPLVSRTPGRPLRSFLSAILNMEM